MRTLVMLRIRYVVVAMSFALAAIASLPRLVAAQAPGASAPQPSAPASAPTPSRPGKVFLSGENPYIALRDTPDGPARATASFWRIHWSPVGSGHVCYVTVGDAKTPGAVRLALYDNKALLDYLTRRSLRAAIRSRSGARPVDRLSTTSSSSGAISGSPVSSTSCLAAARPIRSGSRICASRRAARR
jgi:hypothetical protein